MLERDQLVDNIRSQANRLLGPLGRRITNAKADQLHTQFLTEVPAYALAVACAHTAGTLLKELQQEVSTSPDPAAEIRTLSATAARTLPSDKPVMAEIARFLQFYDSQTLKVA